MTIDRRSDSDRFAELLADTLGRAWGTKVMSNRGFLGKSPVPVEDSPYSGFTPERWALEFIYMYGQIDGERHKAWVLDQVVRVLNGAPVNVTKASWVTEEDEFRFETQVPPPQAYYEWIDKYQGETDADGEREYGYDEGICP